MSRLHQHLSATMAKVKNGRLPPEWTQLTGRRSKQRWDERASVSRETFTAIHHHLLRETPRIIYMHVHAHGDAVRIAAGIKAALALTGTQPPRRRHRRLEATRESIPLESRKHWALLAE
jgi:hypothetical protein